MADETNVPHGDEQKIRLNPAKTGNGDTDKIKLSGQGPTPPKITLRSADQPKKDTTRIELGSAKPPVGHGPDTGIHELSSTGTQGEFYKKSTIRIDPKPPAPDHAARAPGSAVDSRSSTIRIDSASSQSPGAANETARIDVKKTTVRVDQPAAGQTQQVQGETGRLDVKRSTIRIDNAPSGSPTETAKIQGETARIDVKRTTLRVDQPPAGQTQQMQNETSRIEQKKSTIRIDAIPQSSDTQRAGTGGETRRIDIKSVETGQMQPPAEAPSLSDAQLQQQLKKETTRLEVPPEVIKRQTGRIQIPSTSEPPDVFKKRTAQISVPPMVPTAPSASQVGSDSIARPKTIQVRRAPRPSAAETPSKPVAVPPTVAEQTAQARKSETARLDLPKDLPADDRPVTRPKTIRIKRPDGTTARKALTIARPEEGEGAVSDVPERFRGPAEIQRGVEEPGGVWAILALVALLVVGVLIYVLLAQTFAPDLQFPGKIA